MRTGQANWTKLDMARVIVQALFNLDKPANADNIHVKRMLRVSKPELTRQVKLAFRSLEQRGMQS